MFTKTNIQQIRTDLENAIAAVAKKHKAQIKLGAIRYSSHEFSARISAESSDKPAAPIMGTSFKQFRSTSSDSNGT